MIMLTIYFIPVDKKTKYCQPSNYCKIQTRVTSAVSRRYSETKYGCSSFVASMAHDQ